jgi:hypothetical protein
MSTTTSATKTYTGGCHCGYIRYSVQLDLTEPKAFKCNCSICIKLNALGVEITPPSDFTLQSPSTTDDPNLGDYTHGNKSIHYYFCKTCSVICFVQGGYVTYDGKTVEFLKLNAVTLDPDQGIDFRKFKTQYWDGKHDNWAAGTKDEPYLGGCY